MICKGSLPCNPLVTEIADLGGQSGLKETKLALVAGQGCNNGHDHRSVAVKRGGHGMYRKSHIKALTVVLAACKKAKKVAETPEVVTTLPAAAPAVVKAVGKQAKNILLVLVQRN